jgi:hypothetical protein
MADIDNDTTYPVEASIDDTDQFVKIDKGDDTLKKTAWSVFKSTLKTYLDTLYGTHRICGFVSNPQAVYTQRAQIVMFRAPAAITITRIHIHLADLSPTAEMAGDLKWATDVNIGGFADAAVIDVCDTTNGVFTATSSFDDATVASGKYIYYQMDSSPHADIKDFYIEFYYTVD